MKQSKDSKSSQGDNKKVVNLSYYRLRKQLEEQGLEFFNDKKGNIKVIRRNKKAE